MESMTLVEPEVPKIEGLPEIEHFEKEVKTLEQQAAELVIFDDASEEAALIFISGCKTLYDEMEESRTEKVSAHNDYVKAVNKAYKPFTEILTRLREATDRQRSAHLKNKQEKIEAANRKAIADAEQKRREEEAKAEAARQEAERLRLEAERIEEARIAREYQEEMDRLEIKNRKKREAQAIIDAQRAGDEAKAREAAQSMAAADAEEEERARKAEEARQADIVEKARLEKAAIKQDTKADAAESKALMTAPTLTGASLATGMKTLLNGSKVGSRKNVDWAFSNGSPSETIFYRDDPRFRNISDAFFKFDPSLMSKQVKAGIKPEGVTVIESFSSVNRKA